MFSKRHTIGNGLAHMIGISVKALQRTLTDG